MNAAKMAGDAARSAKNSRNVGGGQSCRQHGERSAFLFFSFFVRECMCLRVSPMFWKELLLVINLGRNLPRIYIWCAFLLFLLFSSFFFCSRPSLYLRCLTGKAPLSTHVLAHLCHTVEESTHTHTTLQSPCVSFCSTVFTFKC
jgi:hypothetical protein